MTSAIRPISSTRSSKKLIGYHIQKLRHDRQHQQEHDALGDARRAGRLDHHDERIEDKVTNRMSMMSINLIVGNIAKTSRKKLIIESIRQAPLVWYTISIQL